MMMRITVGCWHPMGLECNGSWRAMAENEFRITLALGHRVTRVATAAKARYATTNTGYER
jgi:hypothetical protein